MLRIRGKVACVRRSSGSTRPHTDAATALRVCILVEYSVTLAVVDGASLCNKVKFSNEKCSLYTGLLSQFVEFFATLWYYPRIRGKVASLLISTLNELPQMAMRTFRRCPTEQVHRPPRHQDALHDSTSMGTVVVTTSLSNGSESELHACTSIPPKTENVPSYRHKLEILSCLNRSSSSDRDPKKDLPG